MGDISGKKQNLEEFSHVMKRDWDDRARHDAKWFINTLKFQQTEEEFDRSGILEVERLVLADLQQLTRRRDPGSLRLLEIGCGTGRMIKHLARVFGEVAGTDVSGEMIRHAQEKLKGFTNVALYETNGIDFPMLPDESFDLVLSAYVFQHVPSVEVIASNIRESWRVLKPGGVFKFQTSGITTLDFEDIEKDTWVGASFPESEIRRFAFETGAQLIGLFGAGTQYCWTTIRKKLKQPATHRTETPPQIVFYGRTFAADNKTIPTTGDQSSLTVIVSGLDLETADCNSIVIEFGDLGILPRYVGPVGRNFEGALIAGLGQSIDHLAQIEIGVPAGLPACVAPVRVRGEDGQASVAIDVELVEAQPVIPKIGTIVNAFDNGTDISARGEKSRLKILVDGLNEAADTGNIRVQIGERIVKPTRVAFLAANNIYQVEAQLPGDTKSGVTELRIYFGNLQSPAAGLVIH